MWIADLQIGRKPLASSTLAGFWKEKNIWQVSPDPGFRRRFALGFTSSAPPWVMVCPIVFPFHNPASAEGANLPRKKRCRYREIVTSLNQSIPFRDDSRIVRGENWKMTPDEVLCGDRRSSDRLCEQSKAVGRPRLDQKYYQQECRWRGTGKQGCFRPQRNLQPVTIPDNDLLDQTFQVVLFSVFGIDVNIAFADQVGGVFVEFRP